ncbi:MAG: hypothetical protein M1834_005807 [Cirrosporium novae-zelandiae]|nr:MAG: hypothetical protein M1834_005807 [Cirrosporium novae-zelandiae]
MSSRFSHSIYSMDPISTIPTRDDNRESDVETKELNTTISDSVEISQSSHAEKINSQTCSHDGSGFTDIITYPEIEVSWEPEEEKKLLLKIDLIVMPLLMFTQLALQFDRANISYALNDYFTQDVGITQREFNSGVQLFHAGMLILEIPSNIVMYSIGATYWIGAQVFAWGLVAVLQAFQRGRSAYYATRFVLGVCESGYIPAALFTLSRWYKTTETSKRFSIFFLCNVFAQAFGGLIAFGVLRMRGISNLTGWQWLFIIEGLYTILVGVVYNILMPKSPERPVSAFGISYFTERERQIMVLRTLRDDPSKHHRKRHITREELKNGLLNWKVYPHLCIILTTLAPTTAIWVYAPSMIKDFGFGRLKATAMNTVGLWIELITSLICGILADKTGRRGLVTLSGIVLWWGFALGVLLVTDTDDKIKKYALLVCAISVSSIWHGINGSWFSMHARTPGERSITMALFIMAANVAGIIGGEIFEASDAPHYRKGWTTIVCLNSAGVVICLYTIGQYIVLNRLYRKEREEKGGVELYGDRKAGAPKRLWWSW